MFKEGSLKKWEICLLSFIIMSPALGIFGNTIIGCVIGFLWAWFIGCLFVNTAENLKKLKIKQRENDKE